METVKSSELFHKNKKHWFIRWLDWLIILLRGIFGTDRVDACLGIQLQLSSITKQAQKDVKLENQSVFTGPDDQKCEQALAVMLSSLKKEAHLTPVGQFLCVQKIRNALRTRLLLNHLVNQFPQIQDEEIQKPVFIIGLPRSGTTFLHRSLAQTGNFQYLTLDMALNPVQRFQRLIEHRTPSSCEVIRIFLAKLVGLRKSSTQQDLLYMYNFLLQFLAQRLKVIHECQLYEAEEESIVLDMCFHSQLTEAMFEVPFFSQYIQSQNPIEMYRFLKLILQSIQWQNKKVNPDFNGRQKPWLLKSPNHLEWLTLVVKVFPDARLIHPTREMEYCLASTISASCHARRMCSDYVLVDKVSEHWQKKFLYLIRKLKFEKLPLTIPLMEIDYKQFCRDPQSMLAQIMKFLQLEPCQPVSFPASKNFIQHHYSAQDFNLNLEHYPSQLSLLDFK